MRLKAEKSDGHWLRLNLELQERCEEQISNQDKQRNSAANSRKATLT